MSFAVEAERHVQLSGVVSGGDEHFLLSQVTTTIEDLSHAMVKLGKMVDGIGKSKDTASSRALMHAELKRSQLLAEDTSRVLKGLGQRAQHTAKSKVVLQRLSSDFKGLLSRLTELSKLATQREKQHAPKPDPQDDLHFESEQAALLRGQRHQHQQRLLQQVEYNEEEITVREQGIRYIESAVVEVNQIYHDLAHLVHEQDAMIDTLEGNISNAREHTAQGQRELLYAAAHQNNARSRIWCLLIAVVVAMVVLVLLIK